jgi:hypothetical protein
MEAMGTVGGGAIVVKKYQASATLATAGVFLAGGDQISADLCSVKIATTSTAMDTGSVGVSLDTTGTIGATGTENADLYVSVAVNPDLIIRAKMSASVTEDTALTIQETTSASSTGVNANGVTALKEGMLWGYDGANKGIYRRVDVTTGSVTINFPSGIASGDRFLHACCYPCVSTAAGISNGPNLSTLITQCDAETACPGDNDTFMLFDVQLGTEDDDGASNSFYHFVQNQSIFGAAQLKA